jgi:predicted ATPase with chaperone activity
VYEFCSTGKDRARQATRRCAYFGSAPVPWNDYLTSVLEQSARKAKVGIPDLCKVFSDIMLSPSMINQIGQAVYAGKGLFLYGPPGNGKTSIAERVVLAVADSVWIPRTIIITGEIIRLYDPACHELADDDDQVLENLSYDMRWVRIKRPSLIIGGELTLDQFESKYNPTTGINEAPIQLKSNGGTLVIDDFGRQRVDIAELLNRWIVPLAKGVDFMTLNSGRQIEMPFE